MYTTLLLAGLVAGLDNLILGSSLGLLPLKHNRFKLAVSFAACEMISPLLGLRFGHLLSATMGTAADWIGAVCLFVMGAWILATLARGKDLCAWTTHNRLLFALPVLFCIDNIGSGVLLGTRNFPALPSALIVGTVSATLSLAGFYVGAGLRPLSAVVLPARFSRGPEWISGIFLAMLAVRIVAAD